MAVMVRDHAAIGMTSGPLLGEGHDGIDRHIGHIEIAQAVQNATEQVSRQHKQRQPTTQTARQSEQEV